MVKKATKKRVSKPKALVLRATEDKSLEEVEKIARQLIEAQDENVGTEGTYEWEVTNVCSICNGRGFTEENAGFVQIKCKCGTLSIHERILIRADESLRDSGGEDTLQSSESEEPETPEGVSEGDSKILPELRDSFSVSDDSDNLQ